MVYASCNSGVLQYFNYGMNKNVGEERKRLPE